MMASPQEPEKGALRRRLLALKKREQKIKARVSLDESPPAVGFIDGSAEDGSSIGSTSNIGVTKSFAFKTATRLPKPAVQEETQDLFCDFPAINAPSKELSPSKEIPPKSLDSSHVFEARVEKEELVKTPEKLAVHVLKSPNYEEASVIPPTQPILSKGGRSKKKRGAKTPSSAAKSEKCKSTIQPPSKPKSSKKKFIDGLDLNSIIVAREESIAREEIESIDSNKGEVDPTYLSPILAAAADWTEPLPGSAGRRSLRLRGRSNATPTSQGGGGGEGESLVRMDDDAPMAVTKVTRGRKRTITESEDDVKKSKKASPRHGTLTQLFKKLKKEASADAKRDESGGDVNAKIDPSNVDESTNVSTSALVEAGKDPNDSAVQTAGDEGNRFKSPLVSKGFAVTTSALSPFIRKRSVKRTFENANPSNHGDYDPTPLLFLEAPSSVPAEDKVKSLPDPAIVSVSNLAESDSSAVSSNFKSEHPPGLSKAAPDTAVSPDRPRADVDGLPAVERSSVSGASSPGGTSSTFGPNNDTMILKEGSSSGDDEGEPYSLEKEFADESTISKALSQGFSPNEGREVGFAPSSSFSQRRNFFREVEANNNRSNLSFVERKFVCDSLESKIERLRYAFGVVFIASGSRLILYGRKDEVMASIPPDEAQGGSLVTDFVVVESPFAEKEIYILISTKTIDRGHLLSLWSVSLNRVIDAKEVSTNFNDAEVRDSVFLAAGDDTDVFVGSNDTSDGSATLIKVYLTDTERRPLSLEIDPRRRFQSVRLTSLNAVDNSSLCLAGLFEGFADEEWLSFAQLWDGNSGVALMRCAHPLGLRLDGEIPRQALLVRQHQDGVLFYFFGDDSRDSKRCAPKLIAQNPESGISVPVLSFPSILGPREKFPISWFFNEYVVGAVVDHSVLRLWNLKRGTIAAELNAKEWSDVKDVDAAMDDDDTFVLVDTDSRSTYVNFWSYSPD